MSNSSGPVRTRPATGSRRLLAARGRSRAWLAAAVGAGLLALGAALAPWTFSTAALIEEISGQLRASSGLLVAAKGRSTFAFLPRPHIVIEKPTFADPAAALAIEAERLYSNVRIGSLLTGRLELADIALTRPELAIDLDRKPMSQAGAAPRAAATQPQTAEADKADRARLGVVSIKGGVAHIRRSGEETVIDDIDLTLDWRTVGSAATLSGAFSWRGERPQALLWIAQPGALLRGDSSPVLLRLDSESVRLEAEGAAQAGAKPRFIGSLSASSPSLRQALSLANVSVPLPGPFEGVQLTCKLSAGLRDFSMSDAHFQADDNEFEGQLSLRREGDRPIVHATLASNFVSLKPFIADVPPLLGADGQWSRDVFSLPELEGADVDLRLSAARARLLKLNIDDAALSLMLRGGRLELALADAQAYKGRIKGRATFSANAAGGLDFHANAQVSAVDAGAFAWDAAGREDIAGGLDATVVLDSSGDSVAQVMRELDGRSSLVLTQGEVVGVDFERALRRLDKKPLASALDIRSGRTAVERATATVRIAKGLASVEDGAAKGPGFSLAFAGGARIPERSLAFKAQAAEADASGKPREKGAQIAFELSGPWDDPIFALDAAALIRRSGAVAPLLPRTEPQAEPGGKER